MEMGMLQSSEYVSIWPAKCYHVTYHVTWWSHNHPIPPLALPHPWPWDDRQIISNQSHNDIPSRIPHTPWRICYNRGEFLSAEWFTMIYLQHVSLFGLSMFHKQMVSLILSSHGLSLPSLHGRGRYLNWRYCTIHVFFYLFFCGGISPYTALT